MAAWQSARAATSSLFETMQQVAKQAIEVGENNLNIVATAASNTAQQATAQAARNHQAIARTSAAMSSWRLLMASGL
ncbi:hypothetical protein PO002_37585 [Cupriavidus necator]|uniref:hypothetical protein n=1 Tax=Cupriavidus necator TaxID=106590 RepID=UPI0039C439DE